MTFLEFDSEETLRARFNSAQKRRKASLIILAQERMILNDLIYRYRDIVMPEAVKMRISELASCRQKIAEHRDREAVHHLIMQVESHYVYASLKSILQSQSHDEYI